MDNHISLIGFNTFNAILFTSKFCAALSLIVRYC